MRLVTLIALALSTWTAFAADDCRNCDKLAKLTAEYRDLKNAKAPQYTALQLKASEVVDTMPDKNMKLTSKQIAQIVEFSRLAIPRDPDSAFFGNNIKVIFANRSEFEAAFAKLPKAEAELMKSSLDQVIQIDIEGKPNDYNESEVQAAEKPSQKK